MTCETCPALAVTAIPFRLCPAHAIDLYQALLRTIREAMPAQPQPLGPRYQTRWLTANDVIEIREAHAAGQTFGRIARTRGMSNQNVASIVHGRTWKTIGGPIVPASPRVGV